MADLSISRKQIDEIDSQILELFEKRIEVVNEVAKYKIENGKPVFDKKREEEKIEKLVNRAKSEFSRHAVKELFNQIMSMGRKYQYGVMPYTDEITEFNKVDIMPQKEGVKVCYFGAPGTHTEQAMEEVFGSDTEGKNCPTFEGVMKVVQSGEADYGILPLENSSTGGITANYDLLLTYDNTIVGEHIMKIGQCLIGLPSTRIEDVRKVYSHQQAILQSQQFLKENPYMEAVEYNSTADAAAKVAEESDYTQAAIASRHAARVYGLEVLAEDIQQEKNNSTRFIIIGKKQEYTEKSRKLTLCIELPHTSGSLYNILSHFIYNDLNMTHIESRPIPGKNWEYRFFIDIEGNLEDPALKNALRGVKEESAFMRVLGNY